MEYGFVYIWFDKKHKRYYIGSHWGDIDDGYICSSNWMKDAYRKHPETFKRRVLTLVYTNRTDLFDAEKRWLSFIKKEEIRKRYYNLNIFGSAPRWLLNKNKAQTTAQKISNTLTGRSVSTQVKQNLLNYAKRDKSEEWRNKIGIANKGKRRSNKFKNEISCRRKSTKLWNNGSIAKFCIESPGAN